jgi:fumarate reductase subunit D
MQDLENNPTPEEKKEETTEQEPKAAPEEEKPKTPEEEIPEDEKILSAIGYLNILCVLPLFLKPKSKYCQFHGKQGLMMVLVWLALLIFFAASPILGGLIFFVFLILILFCMYNAYMGKMWKIPVIGDLSQKFDLFKTIADVSGNLAKSVQSGATKGSGAPSPEAEKKGKAETPAEEPTEATKQDPDNKTQAESKEPEEQIKEEPTEEPPTEEKK